MPPSTDEAVTPTELPFGTFTVNKVQPHALVLCLDGESLIVRRVSANTELVGASTPHLLLGKKIEELVEDASAVRAFAASREAPPSGSPFPLVFNVQGKPSRWDAFPTHRSGHVVLECERMKREGEGAVDLAARLVAGVESMRGDRPEAELCDAAARAIASLSGYDRVLIYKLMADGHGHVVGECLNDPDFDSYFDLHFPASDIPEEMRALFLRDRSRMIVDAASEAAPLVPDAAEGPLAAAAAGLRFRVPHSCHTQYMRNMGTRASLTTAIVVEAREGGEGPAGEALWGLAVGHSRGPREVGYEVRSAVLVVAHSLAVALGAARERHERAGEARVASMQASLIRSAADARFLSALQERDNHVARLVDADGCAIVSAGSATLCGETPTEAECVALFPALVAATMDCVSAWDCLARVHPPAEKYAGVASGALLAILSPRRDTGIIWFRHEWSHEVVWGGSSEEAEYSPAQLKAAGPQTLRPRGSFAKWRQAVRGRCAPWGPAEGAAARSFLRTLRALEARIRGEAATKRSIEDELKSKDLLLCNLLPPKIMKEMMRSHRVQSRLHRNVCILFADIVGFTRLAAKMDPADLVDRLNAVFSAFDALVEKHGLEKIKTIGDCYMVASGLPDEEEGSDSAAPTARMARFALDMLEAIRAEGRFGPTRFSMRIGMHTGDVVAGVIGVKKFVYDVWGDTVNCASRMESHGTPGMVHMSDASAGLLEGAFVVEERGEIEVKGKGPMRTFYLLGVTGSYDPARDARHSPPLGEDADPAAPLSPLARTLSRLSSSVASAAAFFGRRNSSYL